MTKKSDATGVSLACFPSPSVMRVVSMSAWRGRSLARSYAISGAGGVGELDILGDMGII